MRDSRIEEILTELDAAHVSTGYGSETTFSVAAQAIRSLLRERDCLIADLYHLSDHHSPDEVPC